MGDIRLSLFSAVDLVHELVESLLNSIHVNLVLEVHFFGDLVGHVSINIRVGSYKVLLDTSEGVVLLDAEVDDFVRNKARLLERKSLDTSSGETLNHPALGLLFETFNFLLNELNHDNIVDELVIVEAGRDAGGVRAICCNMLTEQSTGGDALPLEILGELFQVFLSH